MLKVDVQVKKFQPLQIETELTVFEMEFSGSIGIYSAESAFVNAFIISVLRGAINSQLMDFIPVFVHNKRNT